MPELAEVALYARDLNKVIGERKVLKISFPNQQDWGSTIVPRAMQLTLKQLVGQSVSFSSQGKALFIRNQNQLEPLAEIRLGMTGQFHLTKMMGKWKRHYFVSIHFDDISIHYADPRRFGRVMRPKPSRFHLAGFSDCHGFFS